MQNEINLWRAMDCNGCFCGSFFFSKLVGGMPIQIHVQLRWFTCRHWQLVSQFPPTHRPLLFPSLRSNLLSPCLWTLLWWPPHHRFHRYHHFLFFISLINIVCNVICCVQLSHWDFHWWNRILVDGMWKREPILLLLEPLR